MSYKLEVTTAATARALIQLDAVKSELGITTTDDDSFLDSLIAQVSTQIETYCGRVFAFQEYRQTFRLDRRDEFLHLSAFPVVNVDSVVEAGTTLTVDVDYEADKVAGLFLRLSGDVKGRWTTAGKIVVEYSAGYILPGDTLADLPGDIERAAAELVKLRYMSRDRDPTVTREVVPQVYEVTLGMATAGGVKPGSIPSHIAAMLDPYRAAVY